MSFDPAQPAAASPLVSQVMRDQFNALNDAISAIPAGPEGPPGEVTEQELIDERINHARNPTGVSALSLTASDPPTQGEFQALIDKVNELIVALRREP